MPVDGHVYIPLVKITATNPATKSWIVAACFKMQLKIVKTRVHWAVKFAWTRSVEGYHLYLDQLQLKALQQLTII
jgi:uncharacterized integral membrane protein